MKVQEHTCHLYVTIAGGQREATEEEEEEMEEEVEEKEEEEEEEVEVEEVVDEEGGMEDEEDDVGGGSDRAGAGTVSISPRIEGAGERGSGAVRNVPVSTGSRYFVLPVLLLLLLTLLPLPVPLSLLLLLLLLPLPLQSTPSLLAVVSPSLITVTFFTSSPSTNRDTDT